MSPKAVIDWRSLDQKLCIPYKFITNSSSKLRPTNGDTAKQTCLHLEGGFSLEICKLCTIPDLKVITGSD